MYRKLFLSSLIVNPANDRHGQLENETAAIAHLFALQEQHMRNLAKDLVQMGQVFEPPLVFPSGDKYIVADGNRRTTCLKLIEKPSRAPTIELQKFFAECRANWVGIFPEKIECRVETDRDRIDDLLFRRHTGVKGGIGQSTWTDRMKANFVSRTGKGSGINVADEIERILNEHEMTPARKIPRSNLNRLLSAEALRNRLGISVRKGKLEIVRDEQQTIAALQRVATDLALRKVTLDDIWDADAKLRYIDQLEAEDVLPKAARKLDVKHPPPPTKPQLRPAGPPSSVSPHLIPNVDYGIRWEGHLHRQNAIWDELQHQIEVAATPNAAAVLMRVLLEISADNYIRRVSLSGIKEKDALSLKIERIATDLHSKEKIIKKYQLELIKLKQSEELISVDTLNRYVHSSNFSASPEHLKVIWKTISEFIVHCLNA